MIPQLKSLWQICFDDTAAGTDFVFDNLLRPEHILVQTDETTEPIAMLCWQPLTFSTQGAAFDGAYIFGVGTSPRHRGKGVSTALLEKAEEILRGQGVRLSCLVPASQSLFGFYSQRGYATQFYYKLLSVGADQIPTAQGGRVVPAALEDFEERRSKAFGGSLLGAWNKGYLRYTGAECRFWGGEVLRFTCGDGRDGYAACYLDGKGGILVKEVLLPRGDEENLDSFLAALHGRYVAQSYNLRLPTDFALPDKWQTQTLPFAMTKWYYKEDTQAANIGSASWFAFGLDS